MTKAEYVIKYVNTFLEGDVNDVKEAFTYLIQQDEDIAETVAQSIFDGSTMNSIELICNLLIKELNQAQSCSSVLAKSVFEIDAEDPDNTLLFINYFVADMEACMTIKVNNLLEENDDIGFIVDRFDVFENVCLDIANDFNSCSIEVITK